MQGGRGADAAFDGCLRTLAVMHARFSRHAGHPAHLPPTSLATRSPRLPACSLADLTPPIN